MATTGFTFGGSSTSSPVSRSGGFSFGGKVTQVKSKPQLSVPPPVFNTTTAQSTSVYPEPDRPTLTEGVAGGIKATGKFLGELGQSVARDYATLTKAILEGDKNAEVTPRGKAGQFIFGKSEPFSLQSEGSSMLEGFGVGEEKSKKYGAPVLVGLTALDFLTVPGKKNAVIKAARATRSAEEAAELLIKEGVPKDVVFQLKLGERLVKANTDDEITAIFKTAADELNKPADSLLTFVNDAGEKLYMPLTRGELHNLEDEIRTIPSARPGKSQVHLDANIPAVKAIGREVSREEFLRVVPDADQILKRATSGGTIPNAATTPVRSAGKASIEPPKIDQRFTDNFPELGSADRMAAIQSRTRGTVTNKETLEAAQRLGFTEDRVLRMPVGTALNAEEKMAVSGITENARLTMKAMEEQLGKLPKGSAEANALRESIALQKVKTFKLMAVERGIAAESGRALQAHKAAVQAIDGNERWLTKYLADPKVPQDIKDYIYKRVGEFDGTPGEMNKLLRSLNQASKFEMFVEFATAVKLYAIPTHIVNFVSSLSRMMLNIPLHTLSAGWDTFLSKLTKTERSRFMSDAMSEIQGQMMGWRHAGHEATRALMDENYAFEARKLQDFQPRGPAIKGRPGKDTALDRSLDIFGKAVRASFRLLGVEDMLIRVPSRQGALYTLIGRDLRKKGLTPGTDEWAKAFQKQLAEPDIKFLEEAEKMADTNLFQESLHPHMKALERLRHDVPALKLIVPFFRTIVNLQVQALRFSPASVVLPSTRKALRAGGGEAADALAKMTLGSAVMIPLVHMALEDRITLAAPTNPAERDKFYADGKQAYAVRIGDRWVPYHRFSPYADWLVTAGIMAQAVKNDDELGQSEIVASAFFLLTQNFFDKSFAIGINDFLAAMDDPERGDKWIQNFATGLVVPTGVSSLARSVDPVFREVNSMGDAFRSKIPWASRALPAKTDVFGEDLVRPGNAIVRYISPVVPSEVHVNVVREELEAIGVDIGFPGKTAGGFEMDDETYRIFQEASGKIIYLALSQMMMSPEYQSLTPRQKELAVNKIVTDARNVVKDKVAQEQLIMQQIKNSLKDQGYSSEQAESLAEKTYNIIKQRQTGGQ